MSVWVCVREGVGGREVVGDMQAWKVCEVRKKDLDLDLIEKKKILNWEETGMENEPPLQDLPHSELWGNFNEVQ